MAVLSHIVVDDVFDADGRSAGTAVGGAGAYAATGASLATDAPTFLVSGTGAADRGFLADWCDRRRISAAGLFDVGENSPRTRIQYFDDGEREETPVYGLEHFDAHTPLPRHIPAEAVPLGGVYLFHDHEAPYWDEIQTFRQSFACPTMWEISLDSCRPEHLDEVLERLESVDLLSINESEAFSLLGVADTADTVRELQRTSVTVLLRRGARGSLVLDRGRVCEVGTSPTSAQDPTGGGNSYSGAFLAAYAGSGDLARAACVAAAAASAVVDAPGAPEVDDAVRAAVQSAADAVSIAFA